MHILSRIKPSQDPWQKVALLSLQQLTEDMSINEKRVRALEESVITLTDTLAQSNGVGQQDLVKATAALRDLHEEISVWSKQSLDRAEELVVAIRQLISSQESEPMMVSPVESARLAS